MSWKRSPSLLKRAIVALGALALVMVSVSVVSGLAAGQEEGEQPARQEQPSTEKAQPQAEEQAPAVTTQAAQQDEGFKVSYDVDVLSGLANPNMDGELSMGTGRFDGRIYGDPDLPPGTNRLEGELTMPPADGYFVTFGFMPVANTTALVPKGKLTGTADLTDKGNFPETAYIDLLLETDIVLSDVEQDGVALNVGDRCRTKVPAEIRIQGEVSMNKGEPSEIKTEYDIPPFDGCGTSEDLDPLLSGLVSAKANPLTNTMTSRCQAICLE